MQRSIRGQASATSGVLSPPTVLSVGIALFVCLANNRPSDAAPVPLIVNGGFEAGFVNWQVFDQAGGSGTVYLSAPGAATPLSAHPTAPNPLGQTTYAVTDQTGPGTHVLLQPFVVPANSTSENLSFQMFVNDWDGGATVGPLDYTGGPVEYGRVDILKAAAGPFSTNPADIVDQLYIGADAPLGTPDPYLPYNFNLTPFLVPGQGYQLRFAETDNQGFFNLGVDNVSLTSVPEPSSLALAALGAVALSFAAVRRYAWS